MKELIAFFRNIHRCRYLIVQMTMRDISHRYRVSAFGLAWSFLKPLLMLAGGISSTTEPVMMHRILDAIMFRVLPTAKNRVWGYVDLATGEPEFEIVET